jgi:hypothetical protein
MLDVRAHPQRAVVEGDVATLDVSDVQGPRSVTRAATPLATSFTTNGAAACAPSVTSVDADVR